MLDSPAAAAAPLDGSPQLDSEVNLGSHEMTKAFSAMPVKLNNELDMIVNVTREYPFDYATVMFGYIMPFVLVLTLVTNTLVVMVLAQRHMRTPTNIVLFTMAVVDLMTLLSPSPWYFYIYTLGYHDKFLYPPAACYAHHFMTDVIPVFFHTSSIWLALLLASQRYIYVCHPSLASTWCTVPRVKKAILIILVIAFLHQITRFFDNKFESVSVHYNQTQYKACKNEVAEWVQSIDIGLYYITYYIFRIVFVFIIPCVALITLNCLLFRALRRAENKRSQLLKTKFKLIGGNPSTIEGRQSSFIDNSALKHELSAAYNANSSAGPSPSPFWSSRRKISSPIARFSRNNAEVGDIEEERRHKFGRKFSISSLRITGDLASTEPGAQQYRRKLFPRGNKSDNKWPVRSRTPVNQTSDKIVDSSRPFGERSDSEQSDCLLDEREARPGRDRGQFGGARSGARQQGEQRSKESNESCSARSSHSKGRDEAASGSRPKSKASAPDQWAERDYDYTCASCLVCEQQQMDELKWCGRCVNPSTAEASANADHLNQPASQCSSLMGGVTNTTTNDEESSCGNTHNNSSSIYVANDGTLDGIEANSIREDEEILSERESSSLNHNHNHNQGRANNDNDASSKDKRSERNRKSVSADGGPKIDIDLLKSSSVDSRLVCGCPMSPGRRTLYSCAKPTSGRHDQCRDCCPASRCHKSKSRAADSGPAGRTKSLLHRCVASCSNSEPCIKCNHQAQDNSACKARAVRLGEQSGLADQSIPQSNSDFYADRCASGCHEEANKRSNADIFLDGNAAATTTTTTTLYSTQANSIASFLQAQSQQPNKPKHSAGAHQALTCQETHAKSPSFVSTMGRGSRAALIGNSSSTNPPSLVITSGHPSASLRTMDSNRTTLMLIVVVTVFLMVEVPVAIVTILHVIFNTFDAFKDVELGAYLNYIKLFTNFFIMISYSVNFTIYCSMSKKFRETFRDLFMCSKEARRKRAAGLVCQQTQHSQYNNNNNTCANPNQEPAPGLGQSNVQSSNTCNLVNAGAQAGDQVNASCLTMRYTSYRAKVNRRQQECEL